MRILFHAPGLAAFRPEIALPHLLGSQPNVTDTLTGLEVTHKLTGNRGNIIHAEAPSKIFAKHATSSAFGNLATLQKSLGSGYPEQIADNFDIIIISMANFIRPNHNGATLFRALKALDGKVPFIVLGAGLQGNHTLSDMLPGQCNLLSIMNERASIFGVRGELTANWLADNGFSNTEILGCPSLYVYPQSILSIDGSQARQKGLDVNVMTAGHLSIHRGRIVPRGVQLAKAFKNINASYVFQDEPFAYGSLVDEPQLFNEGTNTISAAPINSWISRHCKARVNFNRYYYFTESGTWRQAALHHDLFIGDRFHGGVAAMQAGLPAIFLKHDNRVSELTAHFGLPSLTFEEFKSNGLQATIEELLTSDALDSMKSLYRRRHDEFCISMAKLGLTVVTSTSSTQQPSKAQSSFSRLPISGSISRLLSMKPSNAKTNIQNINHRISPSRQLGAALETKETPNYIFRLISPPKASRLVVSFEPAVNTLKRKDNTREGFGEKLLLDSGFAVLSVLAKRANWYRAPDILEYFQSAEFKDWQNRFSETCTYGFAMGSYGACAFADSLSAVNVVTMEPVSSLANDIVPWEQRFAHGRSQNWDGPYRDAVEGIKNCPSIYAIYSPDTPDARHVARFVEAAGDRLHAVEISLENQPIPVYLRKMGQLKNVVRMCLERRSTSQIRSAIESTQLS